MKKKIIKLLLIIILTINLLFLNSCKKEVVVEKSFPEIVSKLTSYKLTGKMESIFPSGTKECEIIVYYKNPNQYRVELKNAGNNEPQIMIRNNEGVYVLLPTINKVFKVNSSWPNNSTYPFILQSLSKDIISDDKLITIKNDKSTTLEFEAKLFDNAIASKQKVTFDNETKLPTEVLIYDDQASLIMRFVVTSIEIDLDINNDLFKVDETMTSARLMFLENPIDFDRMVSYPTYYPEGTALVQEIINGTGTDKIAVMKYGGEKSFTIIQQYVKDNESIKNEYLTGSIYVMGGAICICANNTIKFYDNGVEYVLASDLITYPTLVKMGESLRTADLK